MEDISKHIVSVRAKNDLTVLNRIITVWRKRRFHMDAFNVNVTEDPNVMQMTIVLDAEKGNLRQVMWQTHKLVDVFEVEDITKRRGLKLMDMILVDCSREQAEEFKKEFKKRELDFSLEDLDNGNSRRSSFALLGNYHKLTEIYDLVRIEEGVKVLRSGVMAK